MNAARRKALEKLRGVFETAKSQLEDFQPELTEVSEEERGAFDNKPESLQTSEAEAVAEACEEANEELSTAITALDNAIGKINEAIEA